MKCCGEVRYSEYESLGAMVRGIHSSALPLRPTNPAGAMPTTVSGTSLIRIVEPSIEGFAANRRRHRRSLRIATGCALGAPSSSSSSRRPAAGAARSARKYAGDTNSASICSGTESPPLIAMLDGVYDATCSSDRVP